MSTFERRSYGKKSDLREKQAQETRQRLIDTATVLFEEKGFHATSTAEIVEAAKVTHGALYHHFVDKTDLFHAVCHNIMQARLDASRLDPDFDHPDRLWDSFREMVRAYLRRVSQNDPNIRQTFLTEGPVVLGFARWRELRSLAEAPVLALLENAVSGGLLREQPLLPLAHLILAMVNESGQLVANSPGNSVFHREVAEALDMVLAGMVQRNN